MDTHTRNAGLLLCAIGAIAFVGSGASSVTSLIPVLLGLALVGCSVLATKRPDQRKTAMHGAAAFALIGILGSASRLPTAFGDDDVSGWAIGANIAVLAVLVPFLVVAVQSFRAARRGTGQADPTTPASSTS
jgi:hypothetical protein